IVQPIVPQTRHSSYPRGMCLFTTARTVAIVFARSAGSESMYCAGVLTFDGGFMDSSSSRTKCVTEPDIRQLEPLVAALPAVAGGPGLPRSVRCCGPTSLHPGLLSVVPTALVFPSADVYLPGYRISRELPQSRMRRFWERRILRRRLTCT